MGNLSKADDTHAIGLSRHNYHEYNNSELRVLRVMLGNRWAWVWFARKHSTDILVMSKKHKMIFMINKHCLMNVPNLQTSQVQWSISMIGRSMDIGITFFNEMS